VDIKNKVSEDFIHIQQSMVNLLVRLSAIERVLSKKGILIDNEYQEAIKEVGFKVSEALETLYKKEVVSEEDNKTDNQEK